MNNSSNLYIPGICPHLMSTMEAGIVMVPGAAAHSGAGAGEPVGPHGGDANKQVPAPVHVPVPTPAAANHHNYDHDALPLPLPATELNYCYDYDHYYHDHYYNTGRARLHSCLSVFPGDGPKSI